MRLDDFEKLAAKVFAENASTSERQDFEDTMANEPELKSRFEELMRSWDRLCAIGRGDRPPDAAVPPFPEHRMRQLLSAVRQQSGRNKSIKRGKESWIGSAMKVTKKFATETLLRLAASGAVFGFRLGTSVGSPKALRKSSRSARGRRRPVRKVERKKQKRPGKRKK
jgi:hypothetical protein